MAALCRRTHMHADLSEARLCDQIGWINRQPSITADIKERLTAEEYDRARDTATVADIPAASLHSVSLRVAESLDAAWWRRICHAFVFLTAAYLLAQLIAWAVRG